MGVGRTGPLTAACRADPCPGLAMVMLIHGNPTVIKKKSAVSRSKNVIAKKIKKKETAVFYKRRENAGRDNVRAEGVRLAKRNIEVECIGRLMLI